MPCWANFVAFWGNGGHRNETGGTFASECGRLNETDIASASEKRARNGRKWCAEEMWVSAAAELTRAKVLSVSIWWKCSTVGCRRIHLRWLRCPWAVAGSGRASRRRAEPDDSDPAPLVWRAPEGMVGLAAVLVGGGGAWPGFETTRRAKLAARTARGRAAAHGHTKQPGPNTTPARRPEIWRRRNQTKSGGPQENLGTTTHAFTCVN